MIVTFYKTKLSSQNRCYDKAAYDSYLTSCEKLTYEFKLSIIPNTVFYVSAKKADGSYYQWQLYNYVTFEYAGLKWGSFITKVQPIAVNETVSIYHSTDNWYYLLENGINFDMHGQVNRAHVNDMRETVDATSAKIYVPTLDNTYVSPESSCSANGFNVSYTEVKPYDGNKPDGWHYIYILVNNPNQAGFTYGESGATKTDYESNCHQYYYNSLGNKTRSINMLLCGVVNDDGLISFYISHSSETAAISESFQSYVINLQSDSITKVMISDIPPNEYCSIRKVNNVGYIYYTNTSDSISLGHANNLRGLPQNFSVLNYFNAVKVYANPTFNANNFELYSGNTSLGFHYKNDYNTYLNYGICKLRMSPYCALSYAGKTIDYSKYNSKEYPDDSFEFRVNYGIDYSFNYYYYSIDGLKTIDKDSSFTYVNCLNAFDPIVTRSYFDQYNLSIISANSTTKKINLGFGLFNSIASIAGSVLSGNKGGIISGVTGLAQGVSTIGYKAKAINAEKEKAVGQINNGEISSDTAVGFYASLGKLDIFNLYLVTPNESGYKQLAPILHRYGYNTPLQLDEIYKNHKRKFFNYFECSSCDIEGVPTDIAEDINTMFESGVHLWSGEVSNWNVPNWQVDVYEWIKAVKNNV